MQLTGKTVLVTGGAGFIGSHIVDECLKRDAKKVIVLDNFVIGHNTNITHLENNTRVKIEAGDVRDFDSVSPLVRSADIVFHEAASKLVVSRTRPRIDLETNVIGTFNVLEAARGNNTLIVHASTGSVLGSGDDAMKEQHPHNPSTLYGISKSTAERYCQFYAREFGVRVGILRYFHVFGPRQDFDGEAGVVSIFLGRVLRKEPPIIFGTGEQIRCLTFVKDDVQANFLLLNELAKGNYLGEVFNVASKTRIEVGELAKMIISKYGPVNMKPQYGPSRPGENLRPIPDTAKIESLGFRESVTFEQGLEHTKQWVEQKLHRPTGSS